MGEEGEAVARPPLEEFRGRIDRKQLWWSLLTPTLATLVAGVLVGLLASPPSGSAYGPPDAYLTPLVVGPLVALLCLAWFVTVLRARYRGGSLFFLGFAYLFGQVILQVGLGFCCCLVVLGVKG